MAIKKQKLTKEQYSNKIIAKLTEMVGKPDWNTELGKPDFTKKTWESEKQQEQFINWLTSELRNDKDFYAANNHFGNRNNTLKNCEQAARSFEWQFCPKSPTC